MRANSNLVVLGARTVLVPYKREHVALYNEWMKDADLQELTASEPLSLQEEYDMQASWSTDEKKCTFIILDKDFSDTPAMAGDINLFLNNVDDPSIAEIMIMIAERRSRGKGLAQEALQLVMAYAITHLGVTGFQAKISETNVPSISLFTRLGYRHTHSSAVFKEVTLALGEGDARWSALQEQGAQLRLGQYDQGRVAAGPKPVIEAGHTAALPVLPCEGCRGELFCKQGRAMRSPPELPFSIPVLKVRAPRKQGLRSGAGPRRCVRGQFGVGFIRSGTLLEQEDGHHLRP